MLHVKNLSIKFSSHKNEIEVVKQVSFDLGEHKILGIVGESGSGKSVTSLSILGLLPENATLDGEIFFKEKNLATLSDKEYQKIRGKNIGMIFQEPMSSLNPTLTCGNQLCEVLKQHTSLNKKEILKEVITLFEKVKLPTPHRIFKSYPHQLSGGQKQRVMIAMAIACKPDLLIADEPTTALDVTIQAQILKLLKRLARERNVSVIFTTHDLGAAYEICDRVTVMYAGQEAESASVDKFFEKPRHPYTKSLLGSLPSKSGGLKGIPGQIPALINPPSGCRFHPRCSLASEDCITRRPQVNWPSDDHMVRCYHPKIYD